MACFRLLESLQGFLDRVEISNDTTNQTVFAFRAFALQVQTLDPAEYQGQTFSVDLGSVEEAMKLEQKVEQEDLITSDMVMDAVTGATASMQLPEDILDNLHFSNLTSSVQRLSYSVFLSSALFQNANRSNLKIGSIIVAARLSDADSATLNTSVQTTFQVNRRMIQKTSANNVLDSVFLSSALFQNANRSNLKIGSIIVAARLSDADSATLNTSVQTTFQVNRRMIQKTSANNVLDSMVEEESLDDGACATWDTGNVEPLLG